jgi:hypothetical protein
VTELLDSFEGANVGRGTLASLVSQGLDEGLSANQMLRNARELGLGIQRQSFLRLVGEVRDSIASGPAWGTFAGDALPSEDAFAEWTGGTPNTFLYRTTVFARNKTDAGYEVKQLNFDVLSHDIISPDEAIRRAHMFFESGTVLDQYSDQEYLGGEVRGGYAQVT